MKSLSRHLIQLSSINYLTYDNHPFVWSMSILRLE